MELEKEKSNKEYEFNETRECIVTDTFVKTANIYSKLGITSANKSIPMFKEVALLINDKSIKLQFRKLVQQLQEIKNK